MTSAADADQFQRAPDTEAIMPARGPARIGQVSGLSAIPAARGGQVATVDIRPGWSTTAIIESLASDS